jgi:hypothetical protein
VTEEGDEVWEYALPSSIFRAERYEADYPAWIGLTAEQLAPKGPLMVVPGG